MQVGIMADSHGRPETIESALQVFAENGCSKVYHLGDICDSLNPDTAEDCIRVLLENSVLAVRGNNEHALIINQEMNPELPVPVWVIEYLKKLEPVIQEKQAVFAHSLPFVSELGVSCMIRGMTREAENGFYNLFPERVLFRGHSHVPEIIWQRNKESINQVISAGGEIDLSDRIPCMVTCGALTRSMCMVWEPETMKISCHSFHKGD
jgi:predicted phosphodiesterase